MVFASSKKYCSPPSRPSMGNKQQTFLLPTRKQKMPKMPSNGRKQNEQRTHSHSSVTFERSGMTEWLRFYSFRMRLYSCAIFMPLAFFMRRTFSVGVNQTTTFTPYNVNRMNILAFWAATTSSRDSGRETDRE